MTEKRKDCSIRYDLNTYKELQAKIKELQRYLFVVAKPKLDADYQSAVINMSAHCSPYLDPLAPDPFDADVELLHSIGRVRGIVFQMIDLLDSKIQTFIDLQTSDKQKVQKPKLK